MCDSDRCPRQCIDRRTQQGVCEFLWLAALLGDQLRSKPSAAISVRAVQRLVDLHENRVAEELILRVIFSAQPKSGVARMLTESELATRLVQAGGRDAHHSHRELVRRFKLRLPFTGVAFDRIQPYFRAREHPVDRDPQSEPLSAFRNPPD